MTSAPALDRTVWRTGALPPADVILPGEARRAIEEIERALDRSCPAGEARELLGAALKATAHLDGLNPTSDLTDGLLRLRRDALARAYGLALFAFVRSRDFLVFWFPKFCSEDGFDGPGAYDFVLAARVLVAVLDVADARREPARVLSFRRDPAGGAA